MTASARLLSRTRTVLDAFRTMHGREAAGAWAAPGRINVIGEHTDYNGGLALPIALQLCCVAAAAPAAGPHSSVRSLQRPGEVVHFPAASVAPGDVTGWAAYAAGMFWALRTAGSEVIDLDLVLDSDVPLGAGLSSSAAVQCAVGLALDDLGCLDRSRTALARAADRAENGFVGAPTGGMDQLASLHGHRGHALLLDMRSGGIDPLPLDLERHGLALLVVDTRTPHALVDSEYAERRAACADAARRLGVESLRDVAPADLDVVSQALPTRLVPRVRHVVTENERVLEVARMLRAGHDPRAIGPALTASHRSLRDDFEVSCRQLDVAVDRALQAGAHGARMTGGGFGGCAIALVETQAAPRVAEVVEATFAACGFRAPAWSLALPSDGARRLV